MAQLPHQDAILQEIEDVGYWTLDDASTGKLADSLTVTYEFKTEEGMDLVDTVLKPPIRGVIVDFFKKLSTKQNESMDDRDEIERKQKSRPVLGFYKVYGQTERDVCMMPKGDILIVVAFAKASRMTLYARSQRLESESEWVGTGLFKRKDESSKIPDAKLISMPQGGLAVVDGRLWWRVEKWRVIMLGFMTPKELESYWNPMEVPMSLMYRVEKMSDEHIGMNFQGEEE